MWIPTNSKVLEDLIQSGAAEELGNVEFKRELPNNSKELSKDVAAMANDGGTLIYGVAEDSSGRPSILCPFKLSGTPERVDSIIRMAISEPPTVEIRTLPTERDPELGYLAIIIPASPRAPHMVVVKGDNRFYGRTAKGNTPLSEGEVARLYLRRQQWEHDRDAYIQEIVSYFSMIRDGKLGYAYFYSRPSAPSSTRLNQLGDRDTQRSVIHQLVEDIIRSNSYPYQFNPSFQSGRLKAISLGWRNNMGGEDQSNPKSMLTLEIHFTGEIRLFFGRAAERLNGGFYLFEKGIAKALMQFLALSSRLFEKLQYFGPVDIGVAVTDIEGASAFGAREAGFTTQFDQPFYLETFREISSSLDKNPERVARRLLDRLFHASGAVGDFAPFKDASAS